MKVEKEKFDALLQRMIKAKPTSKAQVQSKTSKGKKLGRIVPKP